MAEKWTNTSSPDSGEIKPNPLSLLNHFTVPFINCSPAQRKKNFEVETAKDHLRQKKSVKNPFYPTQSVSTC
jgi:hypothetical protein